jgi:hypothetical protein
MRLLILAIFVLASVLSASAQEKGTDSLPVQDSADIPQSHISASLEFLNNYVYGGRPASDIYPYLTPALMYTHKSGFYIGASLSYLTVKDTGRVDMSFISAGYARTIGGVETSIDLNKYWYNANSRNPKSDIGWDITANGAYDFGPVRASASVFAMFSTVTDWGSTLAVDHSFHFLNEALEVTPTATLYAGSSKYLNKHYERVLTPKKGNGNSYLVTVDLANASRFKVLDYELSLPATYTMGKLSFTLTPTFAIPVNPATANLQVTLPSGIVKSKAFKENLNSVFFFSLSVDYEF